MTDKAQAKKANRLIHASSPYLLQHAYNPVDWHEWGPEALAKAKNEDKPILVSIGYSSCHWCHVMERESFEVKDIADIMNDGFVCIKVDREERPDLDQVYMEAVQAMGANGGWPLNVFLTPNQKPFYGGTYFPPQNWSRLLNQIGQAFRNKRKEIDASSEDISAHIQQSDLNRFGKSGPDSIFEFHHVEQIIETLSARYDKIYGGIEKAPKFVMPTIWMLLLRCHLLTGFPQILNMVTHTLTSMSDAGLYDQLGGGFSRYSVDREWFAPHFEKMLYDNAQLISLYAQAFSITKDARFKEIIYQTVSWIDREMTSPEGGFYSSMDADSEGVEGKFYTWTYEDIQKVSGDRAEAVAAYYQATKQGNWEHGRNILKRSPGPLAPELGVEKDKLLGARNARIGPALDDKILAGWNAMMIIGLADAYNAFGEPRFLRTAEADCQFLEGNLIHDGKLFRSFKSGRSTTEGFLEDYAFLIASYIALYECTFKEEYLKKATHWCEYTIAAFLDPAEGFFYFSGNQAEPLIARKKEVFDNVIPASNSVMARNLFSLGIILDRADWRNMAAGMAGKLNAIIPAEPGYLSNWGILMTELVVGVSEVVIVGPEAETRRKELSSHYLPFARVMGTDKESNLPLFEGRASLDNRTRIYVCYNKTCKLPVESVREALEQLKEKGR